MQAFNVIKSVNERAGSSRVAWAAGAAFTVSIFVLIAIARVFQESYIIYPLSGLLIGLLLALDERARPAIAS